MLRQNSDYCNERIVFHLNCNLIRRQNSDNRESDGWNWGQADN